MSRSRIFIGLVSAAAIGGCAHSAAEPAGSALPSRAARSSEVERAPEVEASMEEVAPRASVAANARPKAAAPGPSCSGGPGAGMDCAGESCCARIPVPGGDFDMPLDSVGRSARVRVAAFAMDKFEATVGRVRAWITAGQPLPEEGEVLYDDGAGFAVRWANAKAKVQSPKDLAGWARYDTWTAKNDRLPKNFINWHTALAFCHFEGGRLPTEAEWKYAVAGGDEQREYPWGSEAPTPERAVFNCMGDGDKSCSLADILEVGSKPNGAGRWGHRDLAGSMFEWTINKDTAGGYHDEASRGGGFCYIGGVDRRARTDLKPLVYRKESADTVSHMVGVRCAYSIGAL